MPANSAPPTRPIATVSAVCFPGVGNATLDYASFLAEMRISLALRIGVLSAAVCLCVPAQPAPAKEPQAEFKGLLPRATAADYQAQAQAGTVTIGAEFKGHSVPTLERAFNAEDYVVIEAGLFGPPGARTKISADDFSLRINGKKTPLPSRQYLLVFNSLKDPEWVPPEKADSKSKGGLSTGGQGGQGEPPPTIPHMPFELVRPMQQQVQKAALPEGDRPLPQAGLLFFEHRGDTKHIKSLELIYSGPAGKATIALQP